MKRNLADESSKRYWNSIAATYHRVDEWPDWKKGDTSFHSTAMVHRTQDEKFVDEVREKTQKTG